MSWDGTERRQANRKPDNFTPQTAFEGYVKATLDGIEKQFDKLPCDDTFKRLNAVENKVSNIEGKATIFGAIMGFVGGIIGRFIK